MSRLADQLARLKILSEELNKKTDQLTEIVFDVEEFLKDFCSVTKKIYHNNIGLEKGKIVVNIGDDEEKKWVHWSQAPRLRKFEAFRGLSGLIQKIHEWAEQAVKEANEAEKVVKKLLS